jgi:hypothetical protein
VALGAVGLGAARAPLLPVMWTVVVLWWAPPLGEPPTRPTYKVTLTWMVQPAEIQAAAVAAVVLAAVGILPMRCWVVGGEPVKDETIMTGALSSLTLSRRAALLYAVAAGASVAACDGSPAPPVLSESPSTGNVRVSRDGFTWHAEPNLAVNPRDPRNLLGVCIADSESVPVIAAYTSFDAGTTWRSLGALRDSSNGRDPTVSFDAAGRGYVCANTDDLHVWRTDDGGRTFAAPVLATRGHKLDHPWLAADPSPASGEAAWLYAAWTRPENTQLEFGRSTDGGRSFQAPRVLDTVAGPDQANFASPMVAAGHGGTVHAVCLSRDRGRSWTPPRPVPRASDDTVYLQPQLAIDEAGRLALSAFAYRQGQIEVVVLVAEPGTARFGQPRPVTSRPFDPARGTLSGKHGAWWIGDYQGLAAAAGGLHPFWNDPRTGRLELSTAAVPGGAG